MSIIIPPPPGNRIGLLGGSFNPAHDGHLHITELAIKHLELDRVMWMVSPQNPLKPTENMAPFHERMNHAEHISKRNPKIIVSDVESKLGTNHTIDLLNEFKTRFPAIGFVWVMGADSMMEFDQWKDWQAIFKMLPIAIFARSDYSEKVETCVAAQHFADSKIDASGSADLVTMTAPAWVSLDTEIHSESSTRIRAETENT